MNPGKMDRRLTVQVRTMTKDAAGGRSESWSDSFKCWGQVVAIASDEDITADADRETITRQFRIRYKSGIAPGTHRILYQLKFYNIEGIEEEGRRDSMLLSCRSVQSLTHL
jgi:SPP1 family predicted phage head-tail adaptor